LQVRYHLNRTFKGYAQNADIVTEGRKQHPGRAFIFTIPAKKLQDAHRETTKQMIFTLGPRGHTWSAFGIVFSSDPADLEYHGLFISYRWNQPHREAVERALNNHQSVKVIDSIPLTNSFIERFLSLLEHA